MGLFMPEVCRRFARRFPAATLLICGVLVCVAPVGLLSNLKSLDPHVSDRFYPAFRIVATIASGLAIACTIVGILLITRAAQVAIRRRRTRHQQPEDDAAPSSDVK